MKIEGKISNITFILLAAIIFFQCASTPPKGMNVGNSQALTVVPDSLISKTPDYIEFLRRVQKAPRPKDDSQIAVKFKL